MSTILQIFHVIAPLLSHADMQPYRAYGAKNYLKEADIENLQTINLINKLGTKGYASNGQEHYVDNERRYMN